MKRKKKNSLYNEGGMDGYLVDFNGIQWDHTSSLWEFGWSSVILQGFPQDHPVQDQIEEVRRALLGEDHLQAHSGCLHRGSALQLHRHQAAVPNVESVKYTDNFVEQCGKFMPNKRGEKMGKIKRMASGGEKLGHVVHLSSVPGEISPLEITIQEMKLIQQAGKTGSSAKCLMGSGGRSDFSSPKFSSHEAKLIGYGESASQKLKDAEDNILKNAHNIASHSNLLREHTENINTFISTNATFNSQILGLESKSEDFLKYLQVERQRIDNVESELNTLDETVKKAQPKIWRNSERLNDLEAHQANIVKNLADTPNQVQVSLTHMTANQNNNLVDIEERWKQNESQIKHVVTVEKMINGLQNDNAQNLADIRQDLDNKSAENDKNWQVEHDSIRSETNILNQHLEEVRSLHLATNKRIAERVAGNQQLLEKLIGVEKNLDTNSLVTKVNSLNNETKNNYQTIVNLQESFYI